LEFPRSPADIACQPPDIVYPPRGRPWAYPHSADISYRPADISSARWGIACSPPDKRWAYLQPNQDTACPLPGSVWLPRGRPLDCLSRPPDIGCQPPGSESARSGRPSPFPHLADIAYRSAGTWSALPDKRYPSADTSYQTVGRRSASPGIASPWWGIASLPPGKRLPSLRPPCCTA
jgi:hypothetical protein